MALSFSVGVRTRQAKVMPRSSSNAWRTSGHHPDGRNPTE
jgi:hypothetical protein